MTGMYKRMNLSKEKKERRKDELLNWNVWKDEFKERKEGKKERWITKLECIKGWI